MLLVADDTMEAVVSEDTVGPLDVLDGMKDEVTTLLVDETTLGLEEAGCVD